MFPSRNRAAFHGRATQSRMYHPWGTSVCFHLVIERLLISGHDGTDRASPSRVAFPSRYRAASHFRTYANLVERNTHELFPSRSRAASHFRAIVEQRRGNHLNVISFQSRYRAASHFRLRGCPLHPAYYPNSFNLVIERLFISGVR